MKFDNGEELSLYKDKAGKWRWRLTHDNTQIIAASCQGYVNKKSCIDNAQRVLMTDRSKWIIE